MDKKDVLFWICIIGIGSIMAIIAMNQPPQENIITISNKMGSPQSEYVLLTTTNELYHTNFKLYNQLEIGKTYRIIYSKERGIKYITKTLIDEKYDDIITRCYEINLYLIGIIVIFFTILLCMADFGSNNNETNKTIRNKREIP
jgi:hypothetical protein